MDILFCYMLCTDFLLYQGHLTCHIHYICTTCFKTSFFAEKVVRSFSLCIKAITKSPAQKHICSVADTQA